MCASSGRAQRGRFGRRSFSLTELLVVIAIMVVLIGLLLVGLNQAMKAGKRSQTMATMNGFASACQAFQTENGFFPGLIPEAVLAYHNHQVSHGSAGVAISSTENALLHLMGGYVVESEITPAAWAALLPADGWVEYDIHESNFTEFHFKFNAQKFGEGPIIDRKPHGPYFHPTASEVAVLDGDFVQWPEVASDAGFGGGTTVALPDLADAWGRPIIYMRRCRDHGPLVGEAHVLGGPQPQFFEDTMWPYTHAPSQAWEDPCAGGTGEGSILYTNHPGSGGFPPFQPKVALAQILRQPAFGGDPLSGNFPGTPLGDIMLISAGSDGIYFSAIDGPGSSGMPIGCSGCGNFQAFDYNDFISLGVQVIDQFDDLRVWR